jgi:hypothetical protein
LRHHGVMEEERWRRYSGERASALAGKRRRSRRSDRLIGVRAVTHTDRIHPPEWIGSHMQPPFPPHQHDASSARPLHPALFSPL